MKKRDWKGTAQQAAFGGAILVSLIFMLQTGRGLLLSLPFPTNTDQDGYLLAGESFADHFVFMWRAPIYSAWIGIIHLLCGRDLSTTFFVEKIASVTILSLCVFCLGWRLFDRWTGLLMGLWIWNCKYLLLETNGSHTLAASLFILSLLCLYLPAKEIRLPIATLMLFLSAMCRMEMRVALAVIGLYLIARRLRDWFTKDRAIRANKKSVISWLTVVVMIASLSILFMKRAAFAEPSIPSHAFRQNFAANYVERKGLSGKYPDPWRQNPVIWDEALRGAETPFDALRLYPNEISAHIVWNLKLMIRALPANLLAFHHPWLMLAVLALWSLFIFRRPIEKQLLHLDERRLLLPFCAAILLLIPMTIIYRVAARYYQQIIIVEMMAVLVIIKAMIVWLSGIVRNSSAADKNGIA